jgi:hypothetical protein
MGLVKKYAIVSTSYFESTDWKSFHVVQQDLTEADILRIKFYYDMHMRLWQECYAQEHENAKNGVVKDLRSDLRQFLSSPIGETTCSIENYYNIWSEKDLIIEHFDVE